MKDVYLLGYYGMQNQGDNALMHAAAWGAKHFWNCKSFNVSSVRDIDVLDLQAEATLYENQSFKGQNRLASYLNGWQSKRILIGGGSVFHTAQDINIKRHLAWLSKDNQVDAVGVSLGPFENSHAEKACKRFLQNANSVGVRDFQSLQIAKHLVPDANVKLTFDLAPLLALHPEFQKMQIPKQKTGIAVCLCNTPKAYETLPHLARELLAIFEATQEPITLIDFNGHATDALGDSHIHRKLIQLLEGRALVNYVHYQDNPFRTLELIQQHKLTLAMRLHAAVFSFIVDTPFLSLNYHPKCNGWCQQVGQHPMLSMQMEELLEKDQLSTRVLAQLMNPFDKCKLTVEQAVQLSASNWS